MTFHLVDSAHFDGNRALLEAFGESIYPVAFPDPDEREPFGNILARTEKAGPDEPWTLSVIAEDKGKVTGGLIADWYPQCSSLEIIYLAVDPGSRLKGLGKRLLLDGTVMILDALGKKSGEANVYFETENPLTVSSGNSSIDPIGRLTFFDRCGAKRIPIDYVQPPLDPSTDWCRNLFLMVLPQFSSAVEGISSDELKSFLHDFFKGLKALGNVKFDSLMDNVDKLADAQGMIWFDRIVECPGFRISRASVATHFIASGIADTSLSGGQNESCPVFNSYECDLMDYRHQDLGMRPFTTHHHKLIEEADIIVPAFYSYLSEGHPFCRLSARRTIKADISINWSINRTSHDTIAHVVISPSIGEYVTELELIKLITGFGSRQESARFIDGMRISVGDKEYSGIPELLYKELAPADFRQVHTGVSEIEMSGLTDNSGRLLFRNFDEFNRSIAVSNHPEASDWNKAACGISVGIFDFERMNTQEIYDTIQPIVQRDDTFQVLSRGHLVKFCYKSEADYERVENILISPYLLIPSAALVFNELTLENNWKELNGLSDADNGHLQKLISWTFSQQISRRSKILSDVEHSLSTEYIKDIFQYPSETEIFRCGQKQRGLDSSYDDLQHRIGLERGNLEELKSKYRGSIDTLQNVLLLILAIMQIYTAVNSYKWLFFATVALTITIGLLIFIRKRRL